MHWVYVVIAGAILGAGILSLQNIFFRLALNTVGMLNTMLEKDIDDSRKQKMLISRLGGLLTSLFLFFTGIVLILGITCLPLLIFSGFDMELFRDQHFRGWPFWLYLTLGSLLPFIILSFRKKRGDYTKWSRLLHHLVLDHYNLAKMLFRLEKKRIEKKIRFQAEPEFVVVSGLARCGTTGLTTQLFESQAFHSLSYSNLPFLLSPNMWQFFYKPNGNRKKERAHGDKVMFGLNSVEALEEFFFKAFLKDHYISKESLRSHDIPEDIYSDYITYQNMVQHAQKKAGGVYLSKNNNFLLRYDSIRKLNNKFYALFLFREPVNHAYSLLKQHKRFREQQDGDPFILEYMNWLGHHEFGHGHAPFQFGPEPFDSSHTRSDINYWIEIWIHYYQRLSQVEHHSRTLLIDYDDFLNYPEELMTAISQHTGFKFGKVNTKPFENLNRYTGDCDPVLKSKADQIYREMRKKRLQIEHLSSVAGLI